MPPASLAIDGVRRRTTIKIGAPFNVTGALSSLDAPALNGAKLKAKEINDAGGINGKQIELVVYDTKTDPTVIASTASQLVNQDRCRSRWASPIPIRCSALGPIFQQAGIPFVTPGATSPKLPDQIGDMIFLACFGDNVQAAAGADFVTKKLKRQDRLSAARHRRGIHDPARPIFRRGLHQGRRRRSSLRDDYKTGDKTFTAQITKLKASSPHAGRRSTSRRCPTRSASS